jgi:hypothetical protein
MVLEGSSRRVRRSTVTCSSQKPVADRDTDRGRESRYAGVFHVTDKDQGRPSTMKPGGRRSPEIAEKLGVTYTNVNHRLCRGRDELRELRHAA